MSPGYNKTMYAEPTPEKSRAVAGYSKDVKLVPFLLQEYGNIEFVNVVTGSVIDFLKRFHKNNKKYQAICSTLKYGIPAAVATSDLVYKFKKYREIKNGNNSVYNEKEKKLCQLLDIETNVKKQEEKNVLCCYQFNLGKDIGYWLFSNPKTEKFKIKKYVDPEELKTIPDASKIEKGNIYTVIEFEEKTCVWELSFKSSDEFFTIYNSSLYAASFATSGFTIRLKNAIFKEFIASFDIKNNVLYYFLGLHARKRHDSKREINQYSIDDFATEIKKVLQRKKKRG